ncbi:hypothetical protein OURE66S_01080 [Oligella ureolytica]|jgi:undecaprenyl-phosphate galactose phosphotransferase
MQISRKKRKAFYRTRSIVTQITLASSDFIAFILGIVCAILIVLSMYGNLDSFIPQSEQFGKFNAHVLLAFLCIAWFWLKQKHYSYRKPFWSELREILNTILIFAIFDLVIVAFSKWQMSRKIWVLTWFSILVLLPLFRFVSKKILSKLNMWQKQCVIIGAGDNAQEVYHALSSESGFGFDIHYFFSPVKLEERTRLLGLRVIDNEKLLWQTTDTRNTQFIIALDDGQGKLREDWLRYLAMRKCRTVSVVPTTRGLPLNSTDMSFIFRYELLLLRINNNLTKKSARFIKRSFDVLVSLMLLFLLAPVLLIIALWVKRDGGAAIYGHTRIGLYGKPFKCLKFRSMVTNSQEVLDNLLKTDPRARAEWDKDFKLKNDPRITRIGKLLRKTSLDELPQLLNVLKGEMSLVGPRPIIDEEVLRYGEHKEYYLMAKPGMTGLWQVSGRNDVDYETRVYYDAWYVKNWSLWNDIAILFKTVNVVLQRDGAY